jgi:hypothetical protein
VTCDATPLKRDVRQFLREADRRIRQFQNRQGSPGFHPSDFPRIYRLLEAVVDTGAAPGMRFCEWGCGFGVVAGLASLLEFDAFGIEIDGDLIDAARRLCEDFDLNVEFARSSFLPRGSESLLAHDQRFAALVVEESEVYEELGEPLDEFDVIYAYPWPDEEELTARLFEHYAGEGALLITYHANGDLLVRRKTGAAGDDRRGSG